MRLYYVRHGDPIYHPDSLTPFGHEQAEMLKAQFSEHPLQKMYTSTSNRAILTAQPTADMLGLTPERFLWADEGEIVKTFWKIEDGDEGWVHNHRKYREYLKSKELNDLGCEWYESTIPDIAKMKEGVLSFIAGQDAWLASLGYEHDHKNHCYIPHNPFEGNVGFFAHGGCGMVFMPTLLDIPYPVFCLHFNEHVTTGITVIDFGGGERVYPRVIAYNATPHLALNHVQNEQKY